MPGELEQQLLMRQLPESQPPVNMSSNPISQLLSMLGMGGGQDIELPNESGIVDPRIPNVGSQLLKAFKTANKYTASTGSPVERLQKAGTK